MKVVKCLAEREVGRGWGGGWDGAGRGASTIKHGKYNRSYVCRF